jgi:hypothetical protein
MYVYAKNQPVNMIDPTGRGVVIFMYKQESGIGGSPILHGAVAAFPGSFEHDDINDLGPSTTGHDIMSFAPDTNYEIDGLAVTFGIVPGAENYTQTSDDYTAYGVVTVPDAVAQSIHDQVHSDWDHHPFQGFICNCNRPVEQAAQMASIPLTPGAVANPFLDMKQMQEMGVTFWYPIPRSPGAPPGPPHWAPREPPELPPGIIGLDPDSPFFKGGVLTPPNFGPPGGII